MPFTLFYKTCGDHTLYSFTKRLMAIAFTLFYKESDDNTLYSLLQHVWWPYPSHSFTKRVIAIAFTLFTKRVMNIPFNLFYERFDDRDVYSLLQNVWWRTIPAETLLKCDCFRVQLIPFSLPLFSRSSPERTIVRVSGPKKVRYHILRSQILDCINFISFAAHKVWLLDF